MKCMVRIRNLSNLKKYYITYALLSSNLQILSTDFEIGHFLRARIIPKAVLYYTGDVVDEDDEDDFDEEEEEEGKYPAFNTFSP